MSNDPLHERGQAMEDLFFRDQDKKLLDRMRAENEAAQNRSTLEAATGIHDSEVLNHLLEQNISAESLTSVGLIPLIAVAWADGIMEDKERQAILQATQQAGISPDQASYQLIASWMDKRPSDELLASWKDYIGALKQKLEPAALGQLKTNVINRAKAVAESAGGFLGFGNKTSEVEQKVLDELAAAFED